MCEELRAPKILGGGTGRYQEIDVAKGLAVVLMIFDHCSFPITKWIYLFHMPFFFMVSGWLWNAEKASSIHECKTYIKRKIKTLWVPYVITNVLFTVLNNAFIDIGLYTNNPRFLEIGQGKHIFLTSYMSVKEIALEVVKHFVFLGSNTFGGATWFLRTLFEVSILELVIAFLCRKLSGYWKIIIHVLIFLLASYNEPII